MSTRNRNSRARATRKIFSAIGKTITNIITTPYRVLTRSRTIVHPYESSNSPRSSPRSSPINKSIKLKPKPKHTHLDKISEEEDDDDDMLNIQLKILGNGNKNANMRNMRNTRNKRNRKMK